MTNELIIRLLVLCYLLQMLAEPFLIFVLLALHDAHVKLTHTHTTHTTHAVKLGYNKLGYNEHR